MGVNLVRIYFSEKLLNALKHILYIVVNLYIVTDVTDVGGGGGPEWPKID